MVRKFEKKKIPYPRKDIGMFYANVSLFVTWLHFFLCKRSCDKVVNYCKICSRIREHNFAEKYFFYDVVFEDKTKTDRLDLASKQIDFDVYLLRNLHFNRTVTPSFECDHLEHINYAQDIFILFVSVMVRVLINSVFNHFLSRPLTLKDESAVVEAIYHFAHEVMHEFWHMNTTFFYEVFDRFKELNRSVCYEICPVKPEKGPYTFPMYELSIEFH